MYKKWIPLILLMLLTACGPLFAPSIDRRAADAIALSESSSSEGDPMGETPSFAGTSPAPEFPTGLDWLNTANPLTLESLRGKIILLDFWTYGCINCIHIIPDLKQLEAEFPNELIVIGVHSAKFENEGDTDNIREILQRYDITHPVINDLDFEVWQQWSARAWPTLALIDPAGNIVGVHSGEGVYPLFQPVIAALVQEFDALGQIDRSPISLELERAGQPEGFLSYPGKVLVDEARDRIFIADTNHNRILVVELSTGTVLESIGSGRYAYLDGSYTQASFAYPQGMALTPDGGTLYVADVDNHAIRAIDLVNRTVTTFAGTGEQSGTYPPSRGTAPDVALNSPWDLLLEGDQLYIAMAGSHQLWVLDITTGLAQALAGSGGEGTSDGASSYATLAQPSGLALTPDGRLFFADSEGSSIRWADLNAGGLIDTAVGSGSSLFDFGDVDGVGTAARLQHPLGIVYLNGSIYVADTYNHKIKLLNPETLEITTIAGGEAGNQDGSIPLFYEPGGLDAAGTSLYVADTNNHVIRILDLESGMVQTLALNGELAAPPRPDALPEQIILDPIVVAPGERSILIDVRLPEGFKVNSLAPSRLIWMVEGGFFEAAQTPGSVPLSEATAWPVEIEGRFTDGSGNLIIELLLYTCEEGEESLCYIEDVQLVVPVEVASGGEDAINVSFALAAP
ncbi:MAG: redoxin domain-containing protein [Anaerolineales bacterium]|nr:redoxin domain-containing protein [Anaerolineales bacterium]